MSTVLHADVIATDTDLPWNMDAGGSAENPALYLLGVEGPVNHTIDSGAYIGITDSSYNMLVIASGSTLTSSGSIIGSGSTSTYNVVNVVGPGSSWIIGERLEIGSEGSNNHLSIEDGGNASVDWVFIGNEVDANYNSLSVLGHSSSMTIRHGLDVGTTGAHNALYVGYGGALAVGGMLSVGSFDNGDSNEVFVYDHGSILSVEQLSIGGYGGEGNSLSIEDGGLVRISEYWNIDYALNVDVNADNFLNFDGGFLAIEGDVVDLIETLIADGAFRFTDGSSWMIGDADDFNYGYFANDSDAFDFSGYEDLAGYTIITNAASPVPEPASAAVLMGLGAAVFAGCLRRRR